MRLSDTGLKQTWARIGNAPKLDTPQVQELIKSANDGAGLSKTERADLLQVLAKSSFTPAARSQLETYLGIAPLPVTLGTPEMDAAVRAAMNGGGSIVPSRVFTLIAAANDPAGNPIPARQADLTALANAGPPLVGDDARFLLRQALGLSNASRAHGQPAPYDVTYEKKLGLAEANKLVESLLRGDVDYSSYNFRQASDAFKGIDKPEWTLEGRMRAQLGLDLRHSPLAGTLLMLEKDGVFDVNDFNALVQKFESKIAEAKASDARWPQAGGSMERSTRQGMQETLALALRDGVRFSPEARAKVTALAGPAARRQHIDWDTQTLLAQKKLGPADVDFINRINQLVTPPAPANRLSLDVLRAMDAPAQQRLLSEKEKYQLTRLWAAAELPPARTVQTKPLPELGPAFSAPLSRPKPLDLSGGVAFDQLSTTLPGRTLLERLQRAGDSDAKPTTASLRDFDAVLANPAGFTAGEVTELKALRAKAERYLRTAPSVGLSARLEVDRPRESVDVISESPRLSVKTNTEFGTDLKLRTKRALVVSEPTTFMSPDGLKQVTVQKDAPFQLPAGTWTVLRPHQEPVTLEVPAFEAESTVDLKPYSSWVMTNGHTPVRVPLDALESYVQHQRMPDGSVVGVPTDYYAPGALKLTLPGGEYAVPGTDLRVLLVSRVTRNDTLNAQPTNKLTQLIALDAQGKAYSLTPGGATLPDGRKLSVSGRGEDLKLSVDGRAVTVGLVDRVG